MSWFLLGLSKVLVKRQNATGVVEPCYDTIILRLVARQEGHERFGSHELTGLDQGVRVTDQPDVVRSNCNRKWHQRLVQLLLHVQWELE
jgi:hypothetical protein